MNPQGSPEMTGNIENASTPEQVRSETRAALDLARSLISSTHGNPDIQQSFIADYNQVTGEYTGAYTQEVQEAQSRLASVMSSESEISELQERQIRIEKMKGMLGELFENHSDDRTDFAGSVVTLETRSEYQNINLSRDFYKEPYSSEIFQYISSNPDYLRIYIGKDLSFRNSCDIGEAGEKMRGLQNNLREAYLMSEKEKVTANIQNYLLEGGVSPNQLEAVISSGAFNTLIQDLEDGDCNISNIGRIADFNNLHFPEHDLAIDSETATELLGSTVSFRKTENELQIANVRDEISQITGLTFDEIQTILNSGDATTIGAFLDPYSDNERIGELEGEIFELLDIRRDIEGQEVRLSEVTANAEEIYNMTPQEREEYRRLLMSFTGSSINIDISREVHRNFILEKPKERLILLSSAEDLVTLLPQADEVLRNSEEDGRIKIDDINPDFLTHPDILDFFIQQDSLRSQIVGSLPLRVFQDEVLSQVIFGGSRFLWKALFQNIFSVNSSERAISIINTIKNNNSSEIEEHRSYFENSIPREIYTEIIGRDIERGNSTISSFPDNIEYLINPPAVAPLSDVISPLAHGGVFPEPYSPDFEPIGPNIEGTIENLILYIRENGLTEEVLVGIDRLIETGVGNGLNLVSQVLLMLNAGNQDHINFGKQAISKRQVSSENGELREQSGAGYYRYLNVGMQSNQDIIQEMGTYGIIEFTPLIIKNITSEKLLARYLIGYQASGDNPEAIYNSDGFNLLRQNIEGNNSDTLTSEENEILELFGNGMRENINDRLLLTESDILSEELIAIKDEIIKTLGVYLSEREIEILMNLLEENNLNSFYQELQRFLQQNNVSEEQRLQIYQEISDQVAELRGQESDDANQIARDATGLTQEERRELEESQYFEGGEFNIDLIHANFQSFAQEHLEQADLEQIGDRDFIIRYLQSLGLPTSVLERKQEDFIASIQAQSREIQANILRDLARTNPKEFERLIEEGVGSFSQRLVYQQIQSGEINFSAPEAPINGGTEDIQQSSGNQGNQFLNHERISVSGEKIYYTTGDGQEISITVREANIIAQNETAERNLIQTFDAFNSTGLGKLWDIRENIFRGISNVQGLSFQVNEDYINIQELKIIFDSILQSIDEPPLTSTTLGGDNGIIAEMERRNGTNINGVEAQVNMRGESMIEERFILRYFPPGSLYFNQAVFEESLRS